MSGSWNAAHTIYIGDNTNDVAQGGSGNEYMFGDQGDDVLDGGGGDDQIDGGIGSDKLSGGDGNDTLWDYTSVPFGYSGLIGHDTLNGGTGDDHVNVWSPDTGDVADGGSGNDLLEIRFNYQTESFTHVISYTLGAGGATSIAQVDGINTVTTSNFERMLFVANDGNDVITGAAGNDSIAGEGGDDVLKGMGGDDSLDGGTGVQNIDGGAGNDTASFDVSGATNGMNITSGASISLGAAGSIVNVENLTNFETGSGNDTVVLNQTSFAAFATNGGDDNINVSGTPGAYIVAGAGDDVIVGSPGADTVDPGPGNDTVHLGAGDDQLNYEVTYSRADTGSDQVWGEDGNDGIYTAAGADTIDGGTGNDTLYAGLGADHVIGNDGDDSIQGEGGADTLDGGAGNDVIGADYDYWTSTSTIDNDDLTGDDGNDLLSGGLGRDTLDGGAGNDTLILGLARPDGTVDTVKDRVAGHSGNDTLVVYGTYGSDTTSFEVSVGKSANVLANGVVVAHATSIEAIQGNFNNAGDITVHGGALADSVLAGSGSGLFEMNGGNDTVTTGGGADTVIAGPGDDYVTGQIGGADSVDLGSGDDFMVLYDYNAGAEISTGGATYGGGTGNDSIQLWLTNKPGDSFDGVHIYYNGVVIGTVSGFESIVFHGTAYSGGYTGTAGADSIYISGSTPAVVNGLGGADTIVGGSGADTINGGLGADNLTGGGGADVFQFSSLADSGGSAIDVITDFISGDRIDLSAIDADAKAAGNQAFVIGAAGQAGHITVTYDSAHARTEIDLYVDKNASVDGTIYLSGDHSSLTIADFVA